MEMGTSAYQLLHVAFICSYSLDWKVMGSIIN